MPLRQRLPFALTPGLGTTAFIISLHLFCMFCLFYGLYFVSKNLVMAETGKPASFTITRGHFSYLVFSQLVSGLFSRGSIGFVQTERAPNYPYRRISSFGQTLGNILEMRFPSVQWT
jgi:hypothetical protein